MGWNRDTTVALAYDIVAQDKTAEGTASAVVNIRKVTAAFATLTAISIGALVAADRVAVLSRESSRSAYTLGVQTKEVYELARSMSSASTPIDEVIAGIDQLSRSGVKLASLKTVFDEFDQMGEALGMSADTVIRTVVPALNALEISFEDIGKYQDVFTHLVRNSNMELGEFSSFITRFSTNLKGLGLDLYDVSAIFMTMAKHGIEGRSATRVFTSLLQQQEDATKAVTEATKGLSDAQKELNDLQKDGSKTTKRYLEDVKFAGEDVEEIRQLTRSYTRAMEDQGERIAGVQGKISTARKNIAGVKPFDINEALSKATGGKVTGEEVSQQKEALKALKGETDARAAEVVKYTTATEKAAYNMDNLSQILGQQIDPKLAEMLPYLSVISGTLTTISGVASLLGFGGGGAAAGGAAGAAGLGGLGAAGLAAGVGGGLALGGAAVYGMEKAGLLGLTGPGLVRSAGSETFKAVSGAGNSFRIEIGKLTTKDPDDFAKKIKEAIQKEFSRERMARGYQL